jgi:DNA-binding MarR family transcriptional regulator
MSASDTLESLNIRRTYRTMRVLRSIQDRPGSSNKSVSRDAGIGDQGQMSKLLARLERLGLIENAAHGARDGMSNAWQLTALGRQLCDSLQLDGEGGS